MQNIVWENKYINDNIGKLLWETFDDLININYTKIGH